MKEVTVTLGFGGIVVGKAKTPNGVKALVNKALGTKYDAVSLSCEGATPYAPIQAVTLSRIQLHPKVRTAVIDRVLSVFGDNDLRLVN